MLSRTMERMEGGPRLLMQMLCLERNQRPDTGLGDEVTPQSLTPVRCSRQTHDLPYNAPLANTFPGAAAFLPPLAATSHTVQ